MSDTQEVALEATQDTSIKNHELETSKEASFEDKEPPWLNDRLKRESRTSIEKFIKSLKFGSESELKKFVESSRQLEESSKSEFEKLREQALSAKEYKTQLEERNNVLTEIAEAALDALPAHHRKTIANIAGDDPIRQLRTLEQLRKGGLLKDSSSEPASAPEKKDKPPLAKPANTAAPALAPHASAPGQPNYAADYERLLQQNPAFAAVYRTRYWNEISAQRAQST